MQFDHLKRRTFITLLGGAAVVRTRGSWVQQVVGQFKPARPSRLA